MIILNIMTFVICLGMLILFRRLDKSNMKMTKLRATPARCSMIHASGRDRKEEIQ
jgi:hypothetical protein